MILTYFLQYLQRVAPDNRLQKEQNLIFEENMIISGKKLDQKTNDEELEKEKLKDVLLSVISAFDAFGNNLIEQGVLKFRKKQYRNLFQRLGQLIELFEKTTGKDIERLISPQDLIIIQKMFQVRHIYEHNSGVINKSFIQQVPNYKNELGKIYKLAEREIRTFLNILMEFGVKIYQEWK